MISKIQGISIYPSSFSKLGASFQTQVRPQPLPAPYWVCKNAALARELGLSDEWMRHQEVLETFTGNHVPQGLQPAASVYSGHQFGHWAGQLGDGRALSLGELHISSKNEININAAGVLIASNAIDKIAYKIVNNDKIELQLKGAGRTPYSRGGDGRAVLRSSIREFLCSEAMHGLGIATTRALCVTGSDAPIYRETAETAAVVTRTSPSFIRFGHFEHFSHNNMHDELKQLADFVIDNFYPECRDDCQNLGAYNGNPYAALLEAVSLRTAEMVAKWQAVGFCHGVMNTDNMSILGLTLDYGPFQFLDAFNPAHICNHTDTLGRYAYNKQPNVAYWNLFCLGQALLPLIGDQELALAALEPYKTAFPAALMTEMRTKLGFPEPQKAFEGDRELIETLQKLLAQDRVDYSLFWRNLSHVMNGRPADLIRDMFIDRTAFDAWNTSYLLQYSELNRQQTRRLEPDSMLKINPKFVLRNYLGEQAIAKAKLKDFSEIETLLKLLQSPCGEHPEHERFAGLPPDWAAAIEISCSS